MVDFRKIIDRLQQLVSEGIITEDVAKKIYPDFVIENEDEKIKKTLYDFFNSALGKDLLQRKCGLNPDKVLAWLEKQKELFMSGRGLYYYDGEKTTYCGYPATEENPYDFAISQQEKQKENPKNADSIPLDCVSDAKCEIPLDYPVGFSFDSEVMNVMFDAAHGDRDWKNKKDVKFCSDKLLAIVHNALEKQKEQKLISNIIAKSFENSKTDYSLEEREKASDYSERVLPTSIIYGEDEDEYKLHKVIEAAYIAGQKEQKPDIEAKLKEEYKRGWDNALLQLPEEVDSQIWQIANNSAKTWEQGFAVLMAAKKAFDKGKAEDLKEQKSVECINIEKLVEHIKAEFESFRNLLKKKGIDYQPTEVYWTDFARLFVSSTQKLQKPAEWSEDWREEDIQTRFAFYTYKDEDGVLYLSNVFVEEASRNHGFGTKILIAAEKVAETIGATTISLKVKQDSPANAWYRKNGYGYVACEDGYDWLEKNLEYMKPNKQEWSEEDKEIREEVIGDLCSLKDWIIKYDANWLANPALKNMDKRISWLKSLPERFKLQPKQEWSEEDEKMIEDIVYCLPKMAMGNIVMLPSVAEEYANRLEFLRPCPKQEWTKEDEKFVHGLIRGLTAMRDIFGRTTFSSDNLDITETINWLKSFRSVKQEWSIKNRKNK